MLWGDDTDKWRDDTDNRYSILFKFARLDSLVSYWKPLFQECVKHKDQWPFVGSPIDVSWIPDMQWLEMLDADLRRQATQRRS